MCGDGVEHQKHVSNGGHKWCFVALAGCQQQLVAGVEGRLVAHAEWPQDVECAPHVGATAQDRALPALHLAIAVQLRHSDQRGVAAPVVASDLGQTYASARRRGLLPCPTCYLSCGQLCVAPSSSRGSDLLRRGGLVSHRHQLPVFGRFKSPLRKPPMSEANERHSPTGW
jgi:hypothetical protein